MKKAKFRGRNHVLIRIRSLKLISLWHITILIPLVLSACDFSIDNKIMDKDKEYFKELFENDPDSKDKTYWGGRTLIHNAVMLEEYEMLKFFLDQGLNPDVQDDEEMSPLLYAVISEDIKAARILLENGADINFDPRGKIMPALHQVLYQKSTKMLPVLLSYQPDLNLNEDYMGYSPLHISVNTKNIDFISYLINKGVAIDNTDKKGRTSLLWAALWGHPQIITILVENGADINSQAKEGYTPLLTSIMNSKGKAATLLVKLGADVNKSNYNGMAPLHGAVANDLFDTASALLKENATPNSKNDVGLTSLHIAAIENRVKFVTLLIDNGAKINAEDNRGMSPLHRAVISENSEVAKELVKHGADMNAKDLNNWTPLDMAKEKGLDEISRIPGDQ